MRKKTECHPNDDSACRMMVVCGLDAETEAKP